MDSNNKRLMVTNLKEKKRGILIQFLKLVSLPVISLLVVSCDEFRNIWSEGQKQLLPWGEGWETDRRKKMKMRE